MEIKNKTELERYLLAGKKAGCPPDQMRNFIQAGYVALPKALQFHAYAREADLDNGPTLIGLGGARGPGKTHQTFCQVSLDDCQRYEGLKFLFLRKIAKNARESFRDLIQKILTQVQYDYAESNGLLTFQNGSAIVLGGFNNENDIDKYIGIEYDGILLEEATTLSERKHQMLMGSLRTTKPAWRARAYETTNPGGVGHAHFKNTFVIPHRTNSETNTRFVPSNYKDNPFLSKEYIKYLEELPGALGRAWRDGDWDTFEGMAFPQWDHDSHTCEPFTLPDHWVRWRAVDWGYSAPFCCHWFARNPDNQRIYVYREIYKAGLTDITQARMIKDYTPANEMIKTTYMDPAMWTRNRQDESHVWSTADTYTKEGVFPTKADNNRLSGKRKFDSMLGNLPDGMPGLIYFRNCTQAIKTIPELIYDAVHPEDVDTTMEDHAYDTTRYGLTDIKEVKEPNKNKTANPWMMKGI